MLKLKFVPIKFGDIGFKVWFQGPTAGHPSLAHKPVAVSVLLGASTQRELNMA